MQIIETAAVAATLAAHRGGTEPTVHACDAGDGRIVLVTTGLVAGCRAEMIQFVPGAEAARAKAAMEAIATGVARDWFAFFENIQLETGRFTVTPKLVSPVHAPRGVLVEIVQGLAMDPPAFLEVSELQPEGPYRVRERSMSLRGHVMELTVGCRTRTAFAAWLRDVLPSILLRTTPETVLNEIMDAAWRDEPAQAA